MIEEDDSLEGFIEAKYSSPKGLVVWKITIVLKLFRTGDDFYMNTQ